MGVFIKQGFNAYTKMTERLFVVYYIIFFQNINCLIFIILGAYSNSWKPWTTFSSENTTKSKFEFYVPITRVTMGQAPSTVPQLLRRKQIVKKYNLVFLAKKYKQNEETKENTYAGKRRWCFNMKQVHNTNGGSTQKYTVLDQMF